MKITFIELVGFKRVRLARLTRVSYRPHARQQLILGTNGAGKSSLLDELSPLPAHHSNFTPGGYKLIEIDHGAHSFILRSDFKSGNRHSFKKDGIELNEGGTYQVQLRLVKEQFRYTEKLHDLLTGRLKFTDMRPQERREWITELSESDWTYALGEYNRLRTKARDAQGAYRHQQERLTQETVNLSKLTDIDDLRTRHEQLRTELNTLLTHISINTPKYESVGQQLDAAYSRLSSNAVELTKFLPEFLVDGSYTSLEHLLSNIRAQEEQAQFHRIHIERAGRDFAELEAMLASFGARSVETITDAPEQLANVQQQLLNVEQVRFPTLNDGASIHSDNRSVLPDLTLLLNSLPDNSDKRYSRLAIESNEQRIVQLQSEIDGLVGAQNRRGDRLSHLHGTHDSTCPRCQYIWKEGVNPEEVKRLEQQVRETTERLAELREALALCRVYQEEASQYVALWNRFRNFVTSYPRLRVLWDYLLDEGLLENRPNEQLGVIRDWERSVQKTIEREALIERESQLKQIIEAQRLMGDRTLLTDKIHSLEQEIREHTAALKRVNDVLIHLRQQETAVRAYTERLAHWQMEQGQFNILLKTAIDAIKNKLIDEDTAQRHVEMAVIQRKLSDHQTLSGIVEDIAREVTKLEMRYKSYQLLATILSPTEGIIAERLREAIFSIVDQMNAVIASVWTHEMRIMECGFENSDLDYKFPVTIESPDNVTGDISRCSKGQMEMINIAFKLTAMLYLGLLDYPLFMDEPGEGFDEQHRDQIMSLIRQMLDSGHYSQLFMVSHFASNHGSFLDAEVLVLDSSNIALPGKFNEHVILE